MPLRSKRHAMEAPVGVESAGRLINEAPRVASG